MLQQPQGEDEDTRSASLTPAPCPSVRSWPALAQFLVCSPGLSFPCAIHSTCPFKRGSSGGSSDAPLLNQSMALGSLKFQGESLAMQHHVCFYFWVSLGFYQNHRC